MNDRLTKVELVELVSKISNAAGDEKQIDEWIDTLEQNVPHPEVADLIFYPEEEMTAEEIVEAALSYKPIHL